MQPDAQVPQPSPVANDAPQPDYSFLSQQPKKSFNIGGSFKSRLIICVVGFILLIILFFVLKGLLTTSSFSQSDYAVILDRQQEMLHLITTDITTTARSQLSLNTQNFIATSLPSIYGAQSITLNFLKAHNVKVSTKDLTKIFSVSVDNELNSALQTNNFNQVFTSVMKQQLTSYDQNLISAYNATTNLTGRQLLSREYVEAKLLLTALNSASS